MGAVKNSLMRSGSSAKRQEESYNRFFQNAFSNQNIDELIDEGGASSLENFKQVSRKNVKDKGYWDAMFNTTFKGKDGKTRSSKYQRLGDAIYKNYIHVLQRSDVQITEVSYKRKAGRHVMTRVRVLKGQKIDFSGKVYRGGQFLPKSFRLGK